MGSAAYSLNDDPSQAANLYSLLYALEYLERAYIGGYSPVEEYESECTALLSVCQVLEDATPDIFANFVKEFEVNFPLALNRIKNAKPATLQKSGMNASNKGQDLIIFELSEHFITLIDALRLGSVTVDVLYPILHELMSYIEIVCSSPYYKSGKLSSLKPINKLHDWHSKLESMGAHEELSCNDTRQLSMDTEAVYNSFKSFLRLQS